MQSESEELRLSLSEAKDAYRCPVFRVEERTATHPDVPGSMQVFTLRSLDVVSVVPVTSEGELLLVEQHRYGSNTLTLEVPGGALAPGERDPTQAALRELQEEAGYTCSRMLALPGYFMNPALQSARVTVFVAIGVEALERKPESDSPFELIKVHRVPFAEALQMARDGRISHVISALSVLLAERYVRTPG